MSVQPPQAPFRGRILRFRSPNGDGWSALFAPPYQDIEAFTRWPVSDAFTDAVERVVDHAPAALLSIR